MSSPKGSKVIAKITTPEQVKALEKLLKVDLPNAEMIGGSIGVETKKGCEDGKCWTDTIYTVSTRTLKVHDQTSGDYSYRTVLYVDPKAKKAEPISGWEQFAASGVGAQLMSTDCIGDSLDACDNGVPYDIYTKGSLDEAQHFEKIFGKCSSDALSRSDKGIRKMFGLDKCDTGE